MKFYVVVRLENKSSQSGLYALLVARPGGSMTTKECRRTSLEEASRRCRQMDSPSEASESEGTFLKGRKVRKHLAPLSLLASSHG